MQYTAITKSDIELKAILTDLAEASTIDCAKDIARKFLTSCAMQKTIPTKLRDLNQMTSISKIISLCYNTMLSGEGLAVSK